MTPGEWDITIVQGATLDLTLTWKDPDGSPVNLTGASARMNVRESTASSVTLLSLTTADGRITLGGVAGTIRLLLSAAVTATLSWTWGVYDLEIELAAGQVTRLLKGRVTVDPEVTRP